MDALGDVGDRVRLVAFSNTNTPIQRRSKALPLGFEDAGPGLMRLNDNLIVPPGTEGTIKLVDDAGTRFVAWDNGSSLGLLTGRDEWVVL
jgi:hypothetical protein